jgi:hypothetical protein
LLSSTHSLDWQKRFNAIQEITKIIEKYPKEFMAGNAGASRVVKLFDTMNERIKDSNSKVSLLATQSVNNWSKILSVCMKLKGNI